MSVEATGPAEATAVDSTPAPAGGGFVYRLLMPGNIEHTEMERLLTQRCQQNPPAVRRLVTDLDSVSQTACVRPLAAAAPDSYAEA